ncbi:MAG: ORF6N domain-containing protein [Verrucomicrobia bacterium]|nr:ORF6N domain-containing protein [Verrucomicrobiota bacterium]
MTLSRIPLAKRKPPAPPPVIEGGIHTVRGERVILDADLARIYGVETRTLNQAVNRNRDKFPPDFLLQLTSPEVLAVNRSQIVIGSSQRHRDPNSRPFAFTEHGAIMAANILNSPQAVQMSVFIVRAFIKMRAALTDTRELARKLAELEEELKSRLDTHETAIVDVLQRIMALLDPPPPLPEPPRREIGFHTAPKTKEER